jgi:ribosome modulation factor
MMDLDEQTLLHEPDLMLAILRVAAKGEGTLDACVAHLRELLRLAEEDLPDDEQARREHLDHARRRLQQARLIETINGERFQITRRGRSVLVENPQGVDDTILMQFEEFRSAVAPEVDRPASPPAARPADYERGYGAYVAGLGLADNPYPADSSGRLEWENGWSQARDDAQVHAGAAPLKPTAS